MADPFAIILFVPLAILIVLFLGLGVIELYVCCRRRMLYGSYEEVPSEHQGAEARYAGL
jgi:hypothetical protein